MFSREKQFDKIIKKKKKQLSYDKTEDQTKTIKLRDKSIGENDKIFQRLIDINHFFFPLENRVVIFIHTVKIAFAFGKAVVENTV